MEANEIIRRADLSSLAIQRYGSAALRQPSAPVDECDEPVRALAERMFQIMFEARGVGLAAPQVGVNVRMFVACPTGQEDDKRAYVNPQIVSASGWQQQEEGCLSVPGVSGNVKRRDTVTVRALDLEGKPFEQTGQGLLARIFQHEIDHLDGVLLIDRMGSLARLAHRRTLKELEERHGRGEK